jgi:AbrB family looped-hinge helix DNA binding protein
MEKQSHFIWTVKVSDKGQISIPKQAREVFHIQTGDTLILLGDTSRGLAIAKYEDYLQFANAVFAAKQNNDKENNDD